MKRHTRVVALGTALLAPLLGAAAGHATPPPLGPAFALNPGDPGIVSAAVVAGSPGGRFVVSWVQAVSDPAGGATLWARAYRPTGAALARQAELGPPPLPALAATPAIAIDGGGDYRIVWSNGLTPTAGVFVQRVDGAAAPLGAVATVAPSTLHASVLIDSTAPAVAVAGDGSYMVAWESTDPPQPQLPNGGSPAILAQRFDAGGQAVGAPLTLAATAAPRVGPALCADSNGGFVAVWTNAGEGGAVGVSARRLGADGTLDAAETMVAPPLGPAATAAVGCSSHAAFLAVWQSDPEPEEVPAAILAQRFTVHGKPSPGGPHRLDAGGPGDAMAPVLSRAPDGSFIAVWEAAGAASGRLVGRHVSAFGEPLSAEFEIADGVPLTARPSVAHFGRGGDFVVVWVAAGGQILGRRFGPDPLP